jgi:hypothetical protein
MICVGLLWVVAMGTTPSPVVAQNAGVRNLPEPSASALPRWRGFNLLENMDVRWANEPFNEDDFRLISELGFNFVRLPLDYRIWNQSKEGVAFNETKLARIDQAIRWGQKYGIHVCLNFHRAPGYTVNQPPEPTDLWTDKPTQEICARHWAMFAARYRGTSNRYLSFNLFNEPPDSAGDQFVPVVTRIVGAIRQQDPGRLVLSDGLDWGLRPVTELTGLKVAQCTRGYTPIELTHYRASWLEGSDRFSLPRWPMPQGSGLLFSATKTDVDASLRQSLRITGPMNRRCELRLRVGTVSADSTLVVRADGEAIWEKTFKPGPGEGEWKKAKWIEQWNTYQNLYDRDYDVAIPAGTRTIEVGVTRGDWISISEIGLRRVGDVERTVALLTDWSSPPATVDYRPDRGDSALMTKRRQDRQWLWDKTLKPWVDAKQNGIGVFVGEFGCYHQTPHEVTLAWMEDVLANWQKAGIGWAMWNFRGSFGVLDSGRSDVAYERWRGHQLDRKMLELLQKY